MEPFHVAIALFVAAFLFGMAAVFEAYVCRREQEEKTDE